MRRSAKLGLYIWIAGLAVLIAGYRLDFIERAAYAFEKGKLQADTEHLNTILPGDVANLEKISHSFSLIAEAVKPSVVHIVARSNDRRLNEQMRQMFGERAPARPRSGTGSGVIIDDEGHIVTNNHVIADAEKITVSLHDGRKFTAKVVGTDSKTDIAVIQIKADRLYPARFGDSDNMKVGYLVLAIGSPFRLDHTVSHGILSAVDRHDVIDDIEYNGFLQTDAPINPGNSGGPLINTRGEIVGINTAIATESGGNMGVGFSIPSNTVKAVANMLKTGKPVVRGYLGVSIRPIDLDVAQTFGLSEPAVLVTGVVGNGPAGKGGLRQDDILMSVDDRPVRSSEELQRVIATTDPGRTVTLKVLRNQSSEDIRVQIEAQPQNFSTRADLTDIKRTPEGQDAGSSSPNNEPSTKDDDSGFFGLGFEVDTVSPDHIARYRLDAAIQNGVVITRIDPLCEAYDAGLRTGNVITRVGGQAITTKAELTEALSDSSKLSKGVRIWVRQGNTAFPMVLRKP